MDYNELIENLKKPLFAEGSYIVDHFRREAAQAITDLLVENQALRNAANGFKERAEKAEKEKDAAVSDLETIMAYGGRNLDTCQFCKNGQCYARGGTKPCLPKWRGQKEE